VQRLRDAGKGIREIAATLDKSPTTIQRLVKAEGATLQLWQPVPAETARALESARS
jgi:IS30 family transposase